MAEIEIGKRIKELEKLVKLGVVTRSIDHDERIKELERIVLDLEERIQDLETSY